MPVIALTANVGGNIREEIMDKGFQEYIAKPIKQRYLSTILMEFLPPELVHSKVNDKSSENISEVLPKETGKENSTHLKEDKDVAEFIRAVKEMDLTALKASLESLSKKSFDSASDSKLKEAYEAFEDYDFKRLKGICEGLL